MHRSYLVAVAALLLAVPSIAHTHPPRQPEPAEARRIVQEVTSFRDKLAKAVKDRNVDVLRAAYSESFAHSHASGRLDNKDARIASAMAGEPIIEAAPATELSFRVFAGPTVIVTGRSPLLNVTNQKTYDYRWISVYVTARDGWEFAASQATRLPE